MVSGTRFPNSLEALSDANSMALLDRQVAEVLACPAAWGGIDALEPLVLTLAMLRAKVADPDADDRAVLRDYRRFLAHRVGPGAADLKTRLGADATESQMRDILREYLDSLPAQPAQAGGVQLVDITKPHYLHKRAS